MALIVETGAIVANANSYVTLADARAYALARGVVLDADDAVLEPYAFKAMDFLESLRAEYSGSKISKSQRLQYPRKEVTVDGFDIDENEIPQVLKDAECQLIMDGVDFGDLAPNSDGLVIVREKVDVLETEYAPSATGGVASPIFTKALALLAPLLGASAGGFQLRTARA